jgi:hypothetical protein
MIIRLGRPKVVNPMPLPLQNQRTIRASFHAATRTSLRINRRRGSVQPYVGEMFPHVIGTLADDFPNVIRPSR